MREDSTLDITDRVTCYEKGKTFKCECGQGIGVNLKQRSVKCATCGLVCTDRDYEIREPVEHERDGQVTLGEFI